MNKLFFSLIFSFFISLSFAQIPQHYYDSAIGLRGDSLKIALHNTIKYFTNIGYPALWNSFESTDKKPNGKVWDIYSDIPSGTPPYEFTFFTDQCGNYSSEGDCYNREHSFPASWFNDQSPMYSDLFHLYPTDGWVNNKRSNFPYGEVTTPTWTSQNGSKLGPCSVAGYTGTVFEPIDNYKGDLARTYFYMMTCYYSYDGNWPGSDMVNGCMPKPWAMPMLYQWHLNDTVSQKEINRNDSIFKIQHNRNPFIDHPAWVAKILGIDPDPVTKVETHIDLNPYVQVFPNPTQDRIKIEVPFVKDLDYELFSGDGKCVKRGSITQEEIDIESLPEGIYILHLMNIDQEINCFKKIIKTNGLR